MDETWKGGDRRAVAGRTSRTRSRRQRGKRDPGLMQARQGEKVGGSGFVVHRLAGLNR